MRPINLQQALSHLLVHDAQDRLVHRRRLARDAAGLEQPREDLQDNLRVLVHDRHVVSEPAHAADQRRQQERLQ